MLAEDGPVRQVGIGDHRSVLALLQALRSVDFQPQGGTVLVFYECDHVPQFIALAVTFLLNFVESLREIRWLVIWLNKRE